MVVSAPGGVPNVENVKNLSIKAQSPQKSIYSIPTHLKQTITPKQWSQKTRFQPPEVICGFSDAKLKALKDDPHLFTGGGRKCRFFFSLKMQNLGIGVS